MRKLWIALLACCVLVVAWPLYGLAALRADVTLKPNPPETGRNSIEIVLKDEGKPVEKAKVGAVVSMPAMGTMPYMELQGDVKPLGNGRYRIDFEISMGGTWDVKVTVENNGATQTFFYALTTGVSGLADRNPKNGSPAGGGTAAGHSAAEHAAMSPGGGAASTLQLGPQRLQKIGVRFAQATRRALQRSIRAVGVVEADSARRADVTLRYSGYVQKLFKGRSGDNVKAGQTLFTVYSPELVTAQSEFLLAHDVQGQIAGLHNSVSDRLQNLGMTEAQIARLQKTGTVQKEIAIAAPISGTLLEVNVREGSSVNPGDVLYVIGDLSKSYIVARVFQQDLTQIKVGQKVNIRVPEQSEQSFEGRVEHIYPSLGEGQGTGNVRVLPSKFIRGLRPGSYVDLSFLSTGEEMLVVPSEAILRSGLACYVFLERGEGVLEPRQVFIGQTVDGFTEIRSGIKAGEKVAASGTFLLSSEAALRSALPKWKKSPEVPGAGEGAK